MSVVVGWLAVAASVGVAALVHRAQVRHDATHSARMAALRRAVDGAPRHYR